MSGVNDEELRERLEAHNYNVPPITTTTRGLLHKKLIALDEKNVKSKIGKQCYFNEEIFFIFCYAENSCNKDIIFTLQRKCQVF